LIQNRAASQEAAGEIQWKRFDHCFETKQPLLLNVKGVANRNDSQQVTNHWIVVTGFAKGKNGEAGPAELAGTIKAMDIVGQCHILSTVSCYVRIQNIYIYSGFLFSL
jgi:hypothetical protein